MKTKYAAYGSNLNVMQMANRCPNAKVVGRGVIKGWKLIFHGVATIVPDEKAETPVAVWEIDDNDQLALDRYEGYPYMYRKEFFDVEVRGEKINVMVYIMNNGKPALPYSGYLSTIAEGYEYVGLDINYLKTALEDTKKQVNKIEKNA